VEKTNPQKLEKQEWSEIILPQSNWFDFKFNEVWRYRDLLFLLVKRDITASYKQTILGPIWFFVQPLLTAITFMFVFGTLAGLSTNGVPMMLFYLSGITIWNYFSDCLNKTATVFRDNAGIFGKVYFPRLIMPLSIVLSNLVRFLIQFLLFLVVWIFYWVTTESLQPNWFLLTLPFLVMLMAMMALGSGLAISALTTKYRDLVFLLGFAVQLLMYATPVIYALNTLPPKWAWVIRANPLSAVVECFRFAFTGAGGVSFLDLLYSTLFGIGILFFGITVFNRVEKSFMDTV